jgi:hypothetical protein
LLITPVVIGVAIGFSKSAIFSARLFNSRAPSCAYEDLHENPVFDSGRSNVHNNFRGGQASGLQKERQELSHERQ